MNAAFSILGASMFLLGVPVSVIAAQPATATAQKSHSKIVVHCDQGDELRRALRRAGRRTGTVEIEIHGICEESVRITRPDLVLRGTDPATDGIRGDGRLPNTVMLDTVWNIRFENLAVIGTHAVTRSALGIGESFSLDMANCRFEGTVFGVIANRSNIRFEDSAFMGGFAALAVSSGSAGRCDRCTLSDGGLGGRALSIDNSRLTVEDSHLEAQWALRVTTGGAATIRRSILEAVPDSAGRVRAVSIDHGSRLSLQDSTVEGTVLATDKSMLRLHNVTQSFAGASPESHGLSFDSVLRVTGVGSFEGDFLIRDLSEAIFDDGASLTGSLLCDSTADAWCFGSVNIGGSSCSSCTLP